MAARVDRPLCRQAGVVFMMRHTQPFLAPVGLGAQGIPKPLKTNPVQSGLSAPAQRNLARRRHNTQLTTTKLLAHSASQQSCYNTNTVHSLVKTINCGAHVSCSGTASSGEGDHTVGVTANTHTHTPLKRSRKSSRVGKGQCLRYRQCCQHCWHSKSTRAASALLHTRVCGDRSQEHMLSVIRHQTPAPLTGTLKITSQCRP